MEFEGVPIPDINLANLDELEVYQRVNVTVKVLFVSEAVLIGVKRKQDVSVADSSACTTVCLWEDHIDTLKQHYSYKLTGFSVREYSSKKYLTMTKYDCNIAELPDIGEVVEEASAAAMECIIHDAKIVAVMDLQDIKTCLRCSARVEPATPPFGRCSKDTCNTSQLYDLCPSQVTGKLLFNSHRNPDRMITLKVRDSILKEMVKGEVTDRNLLSLPSIKEVLYDAVENTVLEIKM